MAPKKPLSPKQKTVMQHLREGFRDTDAADALDLLQREAQEAVLETLAGYFASPDTLRALVKDEFIRHIKYETFTRRSEAIMESSVPKAILEQAAAIAKETAKSPEYQEALLERMKAQYLKEYEVQIGQCVKDRAWRDAHDAYRAAFRPTRTRKK